MLSTLIVDFYGSAVILTDKGKFTFDQKEDALKWATENGIEFKITFDHGDAKTLLNIRNNLKNGGQLTNFRGIADFNPKPGWR